MEPLWSPVRADVERRACVLDRDAQLEEWSRAVAAHVLEAAAVRGREAAFTFSTVTAWPHQRAPEVGGHPRSTATAQRSSSVPLAR
jgi:hypothetical protein